ncbi:dihydrofolate reductase family protein [Arthrobacter sp. GCM10027362]|uniref:dihydrofolate reductase family protein n=1 Tax=Arthrobacter sp. GCM10027362 TaxID=3273379 RepID=UPI00362ADFA3
MPKLRVHNFAVSVDGYGAGPDQNAEQPLGVGGERLHDWIFATAFGRRMIGEDGGSTGVDNGFLERGVQGIGATIMGRNMFGPVRGGWDGSDWTGWWGENPPFHHPVFVLTHHPRPPVTMDGGTVFNFVTDGIEAALEQAFAAAGGADVRLGGGASTVQQYLRAGLVDDLHLAVVPILLGGGERLFENLDGRPAGLELAEFAPSDAVAHVRFVQAGATG